MLSAFADRADAGRRLAAAVALRLGPFAVPPVVEGMARGGVPVAAEVARALGAALDVVVVRKLGHPDQPELGLGALAEEGVRLLNGPLMASLGISDEVLEDVTARERAELDRRLRRYRGGRPPLPVADRDVVVVDDGLATGFSARAAVEVMRRRDAARVVVGVPVGPPGALASLGEVADVVVCVVVSEHFLGISQWYRDFHQVGDDEVAAAVAPEPGRGAP